MPAKQSLQNFELTQGLKIELVASEPQVVDPIAVRFDELGRMWVVEMRDYPNGPAEGQPPQSRIRILEDRDGDGRYETSRIFADQLLFVTGLQPWKQGVFVTLAGRVEYLQDTDGDGRADRREVWFRGFMEENPQLRANHPQLGLDGYIYVANGLRGGEVVDARDPNARPVSISGMDFRFHPVTGHYEAVSGVGQFGLTFDDFGSRFVCSNRNPLIHIVLEDRYLRRSPSVLVPAVMHDVAQAGEQSRLFPIAQSWTTSTLHEGQFTAACGVEIFRGDALGPEFYGNGFTCDPTGYLVHREVLEPLGATFVSRPAQEGREFLASRDTWFRPVNLETGPDGALYVVDMYRAVIEHPQFMPDELKDRPDLRLGDQHGRIYRIVSAVRPSEATRMGNLAELSSPQLVEQLSSANSWQRETSFRLLLERQDPAVREPLEQLAHQARRPESRAVALWAMQGLQLLSPEHIATALRDPHGRVREQAVRLAESWLDQDAALRKQVVRLASDPEPKVRYQVALSLAPLREEEVASLAAMATLEADSWIRNALVLAADQHAALLLVQVLQMNGATKSRSLLAGQLAAHVGRTGSREQQLEVLRAVVSDKQATLDVQRFLLVQLATGLARQQIALAQLADADASLASAVRQVLDSALEVAEDEQADLELRTQAIELLVHHPEAEATLARLALEQQSQEIRRQSLLALSRRSALEPWKQLLQEFPQQSPAVRRLIMEGVLASTARMQLLIEAMQAEHIKASELEPAHVTRLQQLGDPKLREQFQQLLAQAVPEDRREVLERYRAALSLSSDPYRGREIFKRNCSACHRIGEIGVNVAPDIADSRIRAPEQLLTDILQPNRAIDSNYINYTVLTESGQVLSGVIAAETSSSITLKQAEGVEQTIARDEIAEIRSTGVSLMPEGLEKNIPIQEMADLISFIKNWRYLDGAVPIEVR